MKRKGRALGAGLLLALFAAAAPLGAIGWRGEVEPVLGLGGWAAFWQRAVCFVTASCVGGDGLPLGSEQEESPKAVFGEESSCIDPNGRPKLCAEVQVLRGRKYP